MLNLDVVNGRIMYAGVIDRPPLRFLAALDKQMIAGGLATAEEAVFDLDFHAVMHWGRDPVLENHLNVAPNLLCGNRR